MQSPEGGTSGPERLRTRPLDADTPEAMHDFARREIEALPIGCVLEMELAFDPNELVDSLGGRAAGAIIRKVARRRWALLLQSPEGPQLMDLTDLEAPEPMERILEAVADLEPGASLTAHTPCFPRPLLAQLDRRGLDWEAVEAADESGLVWVRRPA